MPKSSGMIKILDAYLQNLEKQYEYVRLILMNKEYGADKEKYETMFDNLCRLLGDDP